MRILIVRTSAMGDVVHCLPVLAALRARWPEAKVAWVVEAAFQPLLQGHPDIDQLIPLRLRAWRKQLRSATTWKELGQFVAALRAFGADLALDLMGNHKGAIIARLSGATRVLGAERAHRREPSSSLWLKERTAAPSVHAVDRALDLLTALDCRPDTAEFGGEKILLPEPPESAELDAEPAFLVIQAGAGWSNKTYPAHWWGEVAHRLRERCGMSSLVPIAPGEEHLAEQVERTSRGAARAVAAGSLHALAALMRRAQLVLGGDTGPIHLAHALGTPVLCLLGPTDPARNGPYDSPRSSMFLRLPCSFCYKRYGEAKACLLGLAPGVVVERALSLLTASGTHTEGYCPS